jgi:hypothetical protein
MRELLDPSVRDLERIRQAPTDEGAMRVVTRLGDARLWTYSNVRYEEPGRPPYVLGHAQDITTALKRCRAPRTAGGGATVRRAARECGRARDQQPPRGGGRSSMGRITRLERLDSGPHLPPQLDLRRSASGSLEPPSPT